MKYRKKPVEVEARQLTLENMEEIAEWCGGKYFPPNDLDYHSTHTVIVPRPGHVNSIAHCGNWIVRFPDGAMKVMFDDDFSDEYEEIHGDLLLMRADQPVYRLIPCSEVDTPPENALLIRPTGMLEDDQWLVRLGEEEQ